MLRDAGERSLTLRARAGGRRVQPILRRLCILGLLALTGCAPGYDRLKPVLAAEDRGTIWFLTPDRDILSGDLALPADGGPLPTVILMHGCSGLPAAAVDGWVEELRRWGYATFVLDSFGGRGLREVCTDSLRLTGNHRAADAYGALSLLATHPRLDRQRIALMGFSHGAIATLVAGTEWARRTFGGPAGVGFRAFFPFYPYCNAQAPETAWGVAAPVRIHIGALDDWTPAATCQALVAAARTAGFDMDIVVYPDALHSFDSVGTRLQYLPYVENAADCTPKLATMRGPILNLFDLRNCIRRGATVGWSPEATTAARANLRAQLAELFR
jgi:dienelactone hydrolase